MLRRRKVMWRQPTEKPVRQTGGDCDLKEERWRVTSAFLFGDDPSRGAIPAAFFLLCETSFDLWAD
jgi:hypothetical protein